MVCLLSLVVVIDAKQLHSLAVLANKATSYVLDSNRAGSVYTLGANGGAYQKWYLHSHGADASGQTLFELINCETSRALECDSSGKVSTKSASGGDNQRWTFDEATGRIYNVATKRLLDSNYKGDVFASLLADGSHFQRWNTRHEVKY